MKHCTNKLCSSDNPQPKANFYKRSGRKSGIASWCRFCQTKISSKYQKNKRQASPNFDKENNLKRKYGITLKQYESILKKQGGCCAICGIEQTKSKKALCVDHNHIKPRIRGLLCSNCNRGLGLFKDDPETLHRAANYLLTINLGLVNNG